MTDDTDEPLSDWAKDRFSDTESHPGTDEYLELVEHAERTSKRVESVSNKGRRRTPPLSLDSES
jgi:hypothetical protein